MTVYWRDPWYDVILCTDYIRDVVAVSLWACLLTWFVIWRKFVYWWDMLCYVSVYIGLFSSVYVVRRGFEHFFTDVIHDSMLLVCVLARYVIRLRLVTMCYVTGLLLARYDMDLKYSRLLVNGVIRQKYPCRSVHLWDTWGDVSIHVQAWSLAWGVVVMYEDINTPSSVGGHNHGGNDLWWLFCRSNNLHNLLQSIRPLLSSAVFC